MIRINKGLDSVIILVHEIYGVNQHMKYFSQLLSEQGFDIICPNLLGRETPFDYSQDEVAYHHFIENVGFVSASGKIKNVLRDIKGKYQRVYIVGFSVGATVAWLCTEENGIHGMIGYYGSRIRDFVEIEPSCPTLLILPQEEKSFNVDEFILRLDKNNIETLKLNGLHGFSDPYSSRYHKESSRRAIDEMVSFFKIHKF